MASGAEGVELLQENIALGKPMDQYSPSSTFASVKLLPVLSMLFDLAVTALDVKDAFLLVNQKEYMLAIIPRWIQNLLQDGATHWLLKKCLPVQRYAALRWNERFSSLCAAVGFEPFQVCPTTIRLIDDTRRIFLSVHVDDILLICKPGDVKWFTETAGKSVTMKVDGPRSQCEGGVLYYLKKISLFQEGVLIQPNGAYIPKLISPCWKSVVAGNEGFLIIRHWSPTTQILRLKVNNWLVRLPVCFVQL